MAARSLQEIVTEVADLFESSYIYALWDEEDSAEASGWYLAKVTSILPDGSASLYILL